MKNFRGGFTRLALATVFVGGFGGLATGANEKEEMPDEAKNAVTAVKQFLAAKTVDERLRHTLGGDAMRPLMERYYEENPEGSVSVDQILFVRMDSDSQVSAGRHCILNLESQAWKFSVPVMLEEKTDGFKVDWMAFVEFKDRLLEKFMRAYQEEPVRFHVGIQRAHFFGNGVPDAASKDCFQIKTAPPNSFRGNAFLEKDSDLAKELRTSMPWETHLWAVVELQWKKLGVQQWVEVKEVPQMHWYAMTGEVR